MTETSASDIARRILDIIPFVMRVMASEMRKAGYDIAPGHVSLLGILKGGSYTLGELAQIHSVSSATMSNTVTALEERGWVRRQRSDSDRRVVYVELAPEGLHVLDEIDAHTLRRISELLAGIAHEDGQLLLDGLSVLDHAFNSSMGQHMRHFPE
jgi:DNA-binding MarR family transcriptional regulator